MNYFVVKGKLLSEALITVVTFRVINTEIGSKHFSVSSISEKNKNKNL